jgi:hypothetical protein
MLTIKPKNFGGASFIGDYRFPFTCLAGAMYTGNASKERIIQRARDQFFLGAGRLN